MKNYLGLLGLIFPRIFPQFWEHVRVLGHFIDLFSFSRLNLGHEIGAKNVKISM
jgi:hypothetical protein